MDDLEVTKAFRDWTIADASDEKLLEILRHLCSKGPPSDLLRGITINHIQMARTIGDLKATMRRLNAANERTQRLLILLAIVAVCVGAIQAFAAIVSILH